MTGDFDPLPQQRLAIEAPLGPVLVVAGPGAGKTFCLTRRVDYLVTKLGIDPGRICAVTFTNKAAEEIVARLKHDITRGTIHALCLGCLREFAEAAGLAKGFGVADAPYQHGVLSRLKVRKEWRNNLLTRFGLHRLVGYRLTQDDAALYREYAAHLARRHMVDFDDLIAKTAALFKHRSDIADTLAARWDYLLVDEFQDVNAPQYEILKRLAAPHDNFFAVGDDEQSIFSWTGADPAVLERFRRDYGIERPIVLDKNCRSSRQIFETARRVLAQNPRLFEKRLSADRPSEHEVRARAFRDEDEEATWLIEDMVADRAATGANGAREWGDYAMLYRKHEVGQHLEGRLLRAGIPCRLARGRSLIEDDVIRYVITGLRVVRNPDDQAALDAFARVTLSEHFLQEVTAAIEGDFLEGVRALAERRPRHDPDTAKLWRLVYQVGNLRALARSRHSVAALVDELLSQTVGLYTNVLEERHDELSDPADIPEAVRLAERWRPAIAEERSIAIEPQGGLEIALRGMLIAAGIKHVPSRPTADALIVRKSDGGAHGLAFTLFKALQLVHSVEVTSLQRYVTFDFETTDKDVATCGVVEIGAARVVNGEIVDRFHTMVNPYQPIAPEATRKAHGYTDADVQGAPSFAEVLPQFRAFVADDILIAHNGQKFDIPVLRRLAAGREGVDELVFYDTYPLVRSLSRESGSQENVAARLGIDVGRAHHALDDAVTLAKIYQVLEQQRVVRARKALMVKVLDYLGLGLAIEGTRSTEQEMVLDRAKFYTLGRYSDALEFYETQRDDTRADAPTVEDVIELLGGQGLRAKLAAEPDPAERYPAALARLHALMDTDPDLTVAQGIDRLLERVALSSTTGGADLARNRVTLLTLHSTKGLEFSRVYVVGAEDHQLPGFKETVDNLEDEIEEARRLLYVGMTRARDRLVLTRVASRFGKNAGGSRFLDEMGLKAEA